VAVGETSAIEGGDKDKISDLATRVRDLNARLNDIRREQVFQRVSSTPPFPFPFPFPLLYCRDDVTDNNKKLILERNAGT
jgi:hypothetical protein